MSEENGNENEKFVPTYSLTDNLFVYPYQDMWKIYLLTGKDLKKKKDGSDFVVLKGIPLSELEMPEIRKRLKGEELSMAETYLLIYNEYDGKIKAIDDETEKLQKDGKKITPELRMKLNQVNESFRNECRRIIPKLKRLTIRVLVESYYDLQDYRIRTGNRMRQLGSSGEILSLDPDAIKKDEVGIQEVIRQYLKEIPIASWMLGDGVNKGIKGIGPTLAGGLISFLDVTKADHPSDFWSYAGLGVVRIPLDEAREKYKNNIPIQRAVKIAEINGDDSISLGQSRRAGNKVNFNPRVKTLMWKIMDSFIKQNTNPYRKYYDDRKATEMARLDVEEKKIGKTINGKKAIADKRAKRYAEKQFLQDLWLKWRTLEGLPTGTPFVVGRLGHTDDGRGQNL